MVTYAALTAVIWILSACVGWGIGLAILWVMDHLKKWVEEKNDSNRR